MFSPPSRAYSSRCLIRSQLVRLPPKRSPRIRTSTQLPCSLPPCRFQNLKRIPEIAMAPRAYWKGSLKLSLVTCPVALYPASTAAEKTRFHMINRETGNRLKQQMVDADTGDVVEGDQKARGYELSKGNYVE